MNSLSKTILSHSQYFQTPPTTSSSTPPSENDADQDQCSMWVESLRLVRYLLLAICLQPVVDRGKLNCCDHLFCFECILQWSKVFYSSLVDLFSNLLNFCYRRTTLGRKHLPVVQEKVQWYQARRVCRSRMTKLVICQSTIARRETVGGWRHLHRRPRPEERGRYIDRFWRVLCRWADAARNPVCRRAGSWLNRMEDNYIIDDFVVPDEDPLLYDSQCKRPTSSSLLPSTRRCSPLWEWALYSLYPSSSPYSTPGSWPSTPTTASPTRFLPCCIT